MPVISDRNRLAQVFWTTGVGKPLWHVLLDSYIWKLVKALQPLWGSFDNALADCSVVTCKVQRQKVIRKSFGRCLRTEWILTQKEQTATGADVNTLAGRGGIVLQAAAYHGDAFIVRMLLEHSTNVVVPGFRSCPARSGIIFSEV
ncbi:hypothetical protein JB92DRAFT_2829065 [Gautieria morchelliformis]|nr:hypothetical protein JB92DRAFT_2829065 [Gautieria morchelliformis]